MLHSCLGIILNELNSYIKIRANVTEEKVILTNLGEVNTTNESIGNKVIISLVDIIKEELRTETKEYIPQGNGFIIKNPPVTFSLHVLFAAHFETKHMLEGLGYLSMVIAFFQSKNYFNVKNTPLLQQVKLDNLSVELIDLSYQEKSALWERIGAAYRPSVLYKLGTISIEDIGDMGLMVPEVKSIFIQ